MPEGRSRRHQVRPSRAGTGWLLSEAGMGPPRLGPGCQEGQACPLGAAQPQGPHSKAVDSALEAGESRAPQIREHLTALKSKVSTAWEVLREEVEFFGSFSSYTVEPDVPTPGAEC